MRVPRNARLPLYAAGLAVLGLVGSASAAVAPGPRTLVVTDPAGDARGSQASLDITSATVTTTGRTTTRTVRGKVVRTYTPTALVVRLALSAPPSSLPAANFEVDAQTSGCGALALYRDGQDLASGGYVSCGGAAGPVGTDATYVDPPVVAGRTITWTMPFAALPREVRPGTSLSELHAYVSLSEPLTGLGPSLVTDAADVDDAGTSRAYTIG